MPSSEGKFFQPVTPETVVEPAFVESDELTTDQIEQPTPEPELAPELPPMPESSVPAEELSPEAEQAVYDKLAMRQAKQEMAMKKASDKINKMLDSSPREIERTDIDDLLSPTADSPRDEMERTDTKDVTGISDKAYDAIFSTEGIGEDGEGSSGDADLSDLFEVSQDDVMYGGKRRPAKSKRMKRTRKPRPEPVEGSLGGMQY